MKNKIKNSLGMKLFEKNAVYNSTFNSRKYCVDL